ncbi:hypothetical protein ERY430_41237 [Erythrobacter sp. EC-HK427]|nr:hypothetical protein ERY430_41237 [Erythrobacter sp. EC-HK427]
MQILVLPTQTRHPMRQAQIFDGDQNPGLDMIGLRVNVGF